MPHCGFAARGADRQQLSSCQVCRHHRHLGKNIQVPTGTSPHWALVGNRFFLGLGAGVRDLERKGWSGNTETNTANFIIWLRALGAEGAETRQKYGNCSPTVMSTRRIWQERRGKELIRVAKPPEMTKKSPRGTTLKVQACGFHSSPAEYTGYLMPSRRRRISRFLLPHESGGPSLSYGVGNCPWNLGGMTQICLQSKRILKDTSQNPGKNSIRSQWMAYLVLKSHWCA